MKFYNLRSDADHMAEFENFAAQNAFKLMEGMSVKEALDQDPLDLAEQEWDKLVLSQGDATQIGQVVDDVVEAYYTYLEAFGGEVIYFQCRARKAIARRSTAALDWFYCNGSRFMATHNEFNIDIFIGPGVDPSDPTGNECSLITIKMDVEGDSRFFSVGHSVWGIKNAKRIAEKMVNDVAVWQIFHRVAKGVYDA